MRVGIMKKRHLFATILVAAAIGSSVAYAAFTSQRMPVAWYTGHSHTETGETIDAPHHSGGLDRRGCHNASVPYHCH